MITFQLPHHILFNYHPINILILVSKWFPIFYQLSVVFKTNVWISSPMDVRSENVCERSHSMMPNTIEPCGCRIVSPDKHWEIPTKTIYWYRFSDHKLVCMCVCLKRWARCAAAASTKRDKTTPFASLARWIALRMSTRDEYAAHTFERFAARSSRRRPEVSTHCMEYVHACIRVHSYIKSRELPRRCKRCAREHAPERGRIG